MARRLPTATKAARAAPGRKAARATGSARLQAWVPPLEHEDPAASAEHKAAWSECAASVAAVGSAALADAPLFRRMVEMLLLTRRAEQQIGREGFTLTSDTGASKLNPAVTALGICGKAFSGLAAKFGIGPSERDRTAPLGADDKAPGVEDFTRRR